MKNLQKKKFFQSNTIVRPGGNPSKVRFGYKGIEDSRLNGDGDLEIMLNGGKLIQKKPHIYQEIGGKVEGKFQVKNLTSRIAGVECGARNPKSGLTHQRFMYGFQVAKYDRSQPLIIDPTLAYSTYLGGEVMLILALESPRTQPGMRMSRGRLIQPTFPWPMPYRETMRDIVMPLYQKFFLTNRQ